jgi:replicative DNA helicase
MENNARPNQHLRKPSAFAGGRQQAGNAWLDTGLGKLPPQALDLEEAVLGALMIEKDALSSVVDILKPDTFYKEAHQRIYNAILTLFGNSDPIDLLTVTNQLRKTGEIEIVGGGGFVAELTFRVNSAANIEYHARIVSEQALKRALISMSSVILRDAYEDTTDVFELLDRTEQQLFKISESNIKKNYADMSTIVRMALNELETKKNQEGLTGVPSGFTNLDRVTSGWQPTELIILAARPAMGKCLGKGTKVVMFDGSLRKVEDVREGDLLMGDNSTPRRVLNIARGQERMYWIRQNKGIDYRVNESHILSLKRSRTEGPHRKGDVLNISVRDYLTKADKFKTNYKGYKVAVDFPEQTVPLDPYFVGLWLGDGHAYSSRITNTDPEVIDYLQQYADGLGLKMVTYQQANRTANYAITSGQRGGAQSGHNPSVFNVQEQLRGLAVIENKHIPRSYLINSTQNRLKLLAGLIDSDGHYQEQFNCYEVTQKNKELAEQLKYLCDTLGFRCSLKEKQASIASRGYISTVYRLRIFGNLDSIPVRIERKKARPLKARADWRVTGIQVEYDKVDDYYGFTIDGNHLFLLEDMTVTHNTAFVVSALRNAAVDHGKPVAIFSLEMSSVQLVNRLISAEAEIDSEKIRKGTLAPHEWTQLHHKIQRLTEAPIFIDDTPALSILELRAKCRRLKAQHDIQMVVIDYLQLMSGDTSAGKGGNREQEIASISRALKNLAKELNVPVIALSQLSRAVETRGGDKKPQLSDLRESGCLTGDTLLVDATTGRRTTIRELAEANAHNFYTPGTSENWTVGPERVTHVFNTGRKPVFRLTTRSGRTIKATDSHEFLKLTGWYRLDELAVGDRIAVPRTIRVSAPQNPLTNNELILLAHLLGDGCILPKQPYHYTSADEANLAVVEETAKTLFGITSRRTIQGNWQHVYLPAPYPLTHGVRHPITNWYEQLGLMRVRSYDKRVPEALFACDEDKIALFLHHLWATDGNISWKRLANRKPGAAIYYASSSQRLAYDVQHLLLRLGILSTVKQASSTGKYRPMYHVHVQGKEQQIVFLKRVNSYGQRGQIATELLTALAEVTENTNVDVIPKEVWHSVITGCKTDGQISWRTLSERIGSQYCGSTLFKSGVSRQRMGRLHEALPYDILKNLAESDVLWDEIVSIEALGEEDVYDATVPSVHNFVANDIIVHNSIEQDADMVCFLYRPEYYNITADENGNSTAGIGEVIIAKNRSGSLDTIQLRFINKFTKFCDLDSYFEPVQAQGFAPDVNGLSSFEQPSAGSVFKSKANDMSNFGNADPSQETPF